MLPAGYRPATSWVHYTTSCNTQSSAPEDGQNNCPKYVELTGIINKPLLLHLVGCLYYLYQWCTVKQIWDNEKHLLIKYIKSVLRRVAKRLSYIQDARCLKFNVFIIYTNLIREHKRINTCHWNCCSVLFLGDPSDLKNFSHKPILMTFLTCTNFFQTILKNVKCSRYRPGCGREGMTWYPLYRRLGGPQARFGQVRKISHHRGSIPWPSST